MDIMAACNLSRFGQAARIDNKKRLVLASYLPNGGGVEVYRQTKSTKEWKQMLGYNFWRYYDWKPIAYQNGTGGSSKEV